MMSRYKSVKAGEWQRPVCASGPGITGELCKQESAGEALFKGLTPGAVYKFTAKADGNTWSVSHTAPIPPTLSDWQAKYNSCFLLAAHLRKACGSKCKKIK